MYPDPGLSTERVVVDGSESEESKFIVSNEWQDKALRTGRYSFYMTQPTSLPFLFLFLTTSNLPIPSQTTTTTNQQ